MGRNIEMTQQDLARLRNLYMTGLLFAAYYDGEEPYDEYGTDRIGYRRSSHTL